MSRKRYTPEKIIGMLREAEVAIAQGMTVGQVCRFGIQEACCTHWHNVISGSSIVGTNEQCRGSGAPHAGRH